MQEEELKAYMGLKKQEAFVLRSPMFGLVVISTGRPNLTVTLLCWIPITNKEYLNRECYIPQYYQGPDIPQQQAECYRQETISD
jgi:hypothetical protein